MTGAPSDATPFLGIVISPIAFLKMMSTRSGRETAQDAVQIFGGRGITQSGMGKFIEHVRLLRPFIFISFAAAKRLTLIQNYRLVSPHSPLRLASRRSGGRPW
jgi:hypothetical protein